jgi:isoprenylcysteine carboxyl methyltransferase (ICMT) family protein YpbQ
VILNDRPRADVAARVAVVTGSHALQSAPFEVFDHPNVTSLWPEAVEELRTAA